MSVFFNCLILLLLAVVSYFVFKLFYNLDKKDKNVPLYGKIDTLGPLILAIALFLWFLKCVVEFLLKLTLFFV